MLKRWKNLTKGLTKNEQSVRIFFLLFNVKTAINTEIIAKGRIIHVGNSGTEGDGLGSNVGCCVGEFEGAKLGVFIGVEGG